MQFDIFILTLLLSWAPIYHKHLLIFSFLLKAATTYILSVGLSTYGAVNVYWSWQNAFANLTPRWPPAGTRWWTFLLQFLINILYVEIILRWDMILKLFFPLTTALLCHIFFLTIRSLVSVLFLSRYCCLLRYKLQRYFYKCAFCVRIFPIIYIYIPYCNIVTILWWRHYYLLHILYT